MSDFILIDGDPVIFFPTFGVAIVVVQPGAMRGSGPGTINGIKICVEGDEQNVSVPNCVYMTPQYSIPGMGTLKISSLAADQKAGKTRSGSKTVLLKGNTFTARFEVQSPAQQPAAAAPIPDPVPLYMGSGSFVSTNEKIRGS